MGFTTKEGMVRVDFFKQSGKWYTTEEMYWDRYFTHECGNTELFHETFIRCLNKSFPDRYTEMIAVCLKPYHEHSHPILINRGEKANDN